MLEYACVIRQRAEVVEIELAGRWTGRLASGFVAKNERRKVSLSWCARSKLETY